MISLVVFSIPRHAHICMLMTPQYMHPPYQQTYSANCAQFKPFGKKTVLFQEFPSFKCECHIIMQIQYTKNLNPRRFELGTTLS